MMSVVTFLLQRFKSVFLLVLSLWRRALCCFRRRRRPSTSESCPLLTVHTHNTVYQGNDGPAESNDDWPKWQETSAVEEQIQNYRQKKIAKYQHIDDPEGEPMPDFFQDMTPKLTGQTRLVIGNAVEEKHIPVVNNLQLAPDPFTPIGNTQLGEWDEEGGGWETERPEDVDALLREKRRMQRERQQQRRYQQKNQRSPT